MRPALPPHRAGIGARTLGTLIAALGRKLSALLESLPVGVLVADIEGRICQSTETAQRILKADPTDGDSYGELAGQRVAKLIGLGVELEGSTAQ